MTTTISAGSVYAGANISSGNPLVVLSGGIWEISTVLSGGSATLSSGALAGFLTIDQGGLVQGAGTLAAENAVFGSLKGLTLGSGGYIDLFSGGTASGLTISGALDAPPPALEVQSGASVTGTAVLSGAEIIYSGGVASSDVFQSGGQLYLEGGTANQELVLSGGLFFLGGTLTSNLTVISGGVSSQEVVSGMTVQSGGVVEIIGATVKSGVTLTASSGAQVGDLVVAKGGAVVGAATLSGLIQLAGSARGLSVGSGGDVLVLSGGIASGLTGLASSTVEIDSGGSATGTVVSSGGALDIYAGGHAFGDIVSSGGKDVIRSGGAASGTQVLSGGIGYVLASGTVTGTLVSNGGKEVLSSGGVGDDTTVLSGGAGYVYSGGLDNHGVVSSGGAEAISAGGSAGDLTLISGGRLTDNGQVRVAGAGTLAGDIAGSGAIVELGGGDLLLSGGGASFTGSAVISGGTIELGKAGQLGTGAVVFTEPTTGSAVLQIDAGDAPAAGGTFANVISNFSGANDDIDLRSIAFVAGASASVVGSTLTLSDGGKTYKFTLAGTIAGAYPVLSDGHGGTLIDPTAGAPKAIEPKVVAFAHAAAAFAAPGAANFALVSSTAPSGLAQFAYSFGSGGVGRF